MAQLEPGEHVDFAFTFPHKAPQSPPCHRLVRFCNYRSFSSSCKDESNLPEWKFGKMTHTPVKLGRFFRSLYSDQCTESTTMVCFVWRIVFLAVRRTCVQDRTGLENIHHYLLCQTQMEGQIGSIPGAGGHTYL